MLRLIITLILSINSFALVRANKGPIFNRAEDSKTISQKKLYSIYAPFQSFHRFGNKARAARMKRLIKSISSEDYNRFKTLEELKGEHAYSIDPMNTYAFSYRGGQTWFNIALNIGLCVGYTTTLRKFHYLSFFKPDEEAPYDYETQREEYLAFYQNILDDIMNNIPRNIPGFSDLNSFSNSMIKPYLQKHIIDQWVTHNMSKEGVSTYLEVSKMTPRRVSKLYKDLRWFLDRNFQPRIYLSAGLKGNAHAVRVLSASFDGDLLKLSYLDVLGEIEKINLRVGVSSVVRLLSDEKAHFFDMAKNLRNFHQ